MKLNTRFLTTVKAFAFAALATAAMAQNTRRKSPFTMISAAAARASRPSR